MALIRETAAASTAVEYNLSRPHSNFHFVETHFNGLEPLRRIFSQARLLNCSTVLVEKLTEADDATEEDEDLAKVNPRFRGSECTRLAFFRHPDLKNGVEKIAPLGYAIVKKDKYNDKKNDRLHVFESVLPAVRHPNNFVHGSPEHSFRVGEENFTCQGYLYAQQNHVTKSCAHVALRTILGRFHPESAFSYRRISSLAGMQSMGPRFKPEMQIDQMESVLSALDVKVATAQYGPGVRRLPFPFHSQIYSCVESGFPAIAIFRTRKGRPNIRHAIPVFGHTFNEDSWVAHGSSYFSVGKSLRYLPSDAWTSMFVAHDDNCGSNFCIPRRYLESEIRAVLATYPANVDLTGSEAESLGSSILLDIIEHARTDGPTGADLPPIWTQRLGWYARDKKTVHRALLVTRDTYSRHLQALRDWNGQADDIELVQEVASIFQMEIFG